MAGRHSAAARRSGAAGDCGIIGQRPQCPGGRARPQTEADTDRPGHCRGRAAAARGPYSRSVQLLKRLTESAGPSGESGATPCRARLTCRAMIQSFKPPSQIGGRRETRMIGGGELNQLDN